MIIKPQPGPPRKEGFRGRLAFFFLAFLPVPLGLVTLNPERLMTLVTRQNQQWSNYENIFAILTVAFCIIGCVGMLHQRGKKDQGMIVIGVIAGLLLAVVEGFIMAFFGCCYSISHI